jgi:hypothetical protein
MQLRDRASVGGVEHERATVVEKMHNVACFVADLFVPSDVGYLQVKVAFFLDILCSQKTTFGVALADTRHGSLLFD